MKITTSRTFAALGYRNFRFLWLGSIAEHSGEWVASLALNWLVLEMTDSPLMLGMVGFFRFVPMLFFPFFAGVVADRMNRLHLLVATLVGFTLLSLTLAILVYTNTVAVWMVMLIALLNGAILSFNHPARYTIVPNIVKRDDLLNAVSLDTASVMTTRIFAPAIAGFLVHRFGTAPVFLLAAMGPALGVLTSFFIQVPATPVEARRSSMVQNLKDSFRYVRANELVFALILLYLIPFVLTQPYSVLLPIFARDILDVGAEGLGLFYSAAGIGSLIGLLALATFGKSLHQGFLLLGSAVMIGLSLVFFSASTWFIVSLFLLGMEGLMTTTFMTLNNTMLQVTIPDELRGRVMSLREVVHGLTPLGSLLMGGLGDLLGAPMGLGVMGTLTAVVALGAAARLSQVRRLRWSVEPG